MSKSKAKYVAMSYGVKKRMNKAFPNKLLIEQAVRKMKMVDDNKTNFTYKDPESQTCTKPINVTDGSSYANSSRKRRTRNCINT